MTMATVTADMRESNGGCERENREEGRVVDKFIKNKKL